MGRATHKPFDPAAAERQRQARLTREAQARAAARAEDERPQAWGVAAGPLDLPANAEVETVRDGRGRVISAHRADVFDRLHQRGGLNDAELAAVRRLEADMSERASLLRSGGASLIFVDQQGSSEGATQRMVQAGLRVDRALALVGPRQALLLRGLLEPAAAGRPPAWREVVARETRETNPNVQAALVRAALDNLALAYQALDARPHGEGRRGNERRGEGAQETR